ncbi:hypothetical protein NJ76_02100 [Rhodococcus sp. IITR03]|nr:hypothetical protein NJ76_02100 [Rhodococcus sp. IITR03]
MRETGPEPRPRVGHATGNQHVVLEDTHVQHRPVPQRGLHGTVEPVLEVQHALPLDGVWEQIAVEGRVLRQQPVEFEHLRRRDDLVEAHLAGRNPRPVAQRQSVIGIRFAVPDALEDHADTLRGTRRRRRLRFGVVSHTCPTPSRSSRD